MSCPSSMSLTSRGRQLLRVQYVCTELWMLTLSPSSCFPRKYLLAEMYSIVFPSSRFLNFVFLRYLGISTCGPPMFCWVILQSDDRVVLGYFHDAFGIGNRNQSDKSDHFD